MGFFTLIIRLFFFTQKRLLRSVDAIQSTCCVTYQRNTDTNLPDMDRSKGVPVPVIKGETLLKKDRPNREYTRYKEWETADVNCDIIQQQEAKRQEWLQIEKYWK